MSSMRKVFAVYTSDTIHETASGRGMSSMRKVFAACTSDTIQETASVVEDVQNEESLCRLYFLHHP